MLNILKYYSYRNFISDYIDLKKAKNPLFGLRSFSLRVGISPGHLSQIIKGKKNISKEHMDVLATEFKLSEAEKSFFNLLISFDHAESEVKELILKTINVERYRSLIVNKEALSTFRNFGWKHLYMLTLAGIVSSYVQLQEIVQINLSITSDEFQDIFDELVKHSLLSLDGDLIRKTNNRFVLSAEKDSEVLKRMHVDYLIESQKMVYTKSPECRYSVTEFITIPKDSFKKVKEVTNSYLDELASLDTNLENTEYSIVGISLHLNRLNSNVESDRQ